MSLPLPPNVHCVIFRHDRSPPDPPDVGPTAGYLQPDFVRGRHSDRHFTHVLLLGISIDVRDDYHLGTFTGQADRVYVPDGEGVAYRVRFVERLGRGTPQDHWRVYLDRQEPSWPTREL